MFNELERRRAEVERHRENSARLAMAYARYSSTGQGSIEFEDRVDFGITFVERPYVSYGCQIDLDALADELDLDPGVTPPIPQITGAVTKWDQDDRDFYTGAWVAASVSFASDPTVVVPPDTAVQINHDFTFTAIAMKDVPPDLRD